MNQPVYAYKDTYGEQEVEELIDLGIYETTAYVEVFEKVYISEELKATSITKSYGVDIKYSNVLFIL